MKKFLLVALLFVSSVLSAKDLEWTIPDAWELSPAKSSMRLATFAVKGQKDLAISASKFGGNAGGVLANVNRWRGQLGLKPLTADDLEKSLETIETKVGKAKLVNISNDKNQMLAVILPQDKSTYFFKLMGNKELVGKQKENMIKLVKSLK